MTKTAKTCLYIGALSMIQRWCIGGSSVLSVALPIPRSLTIVHFVRIFAHATNQEYRAFLAHHCAREHPVVINFVYFRAI